ncbi:MAG: DUF4474 domain-containing protein, partial [Oscillospiraceae bacterium]|nr:DUF4474 domain-containing protein [Oscillospiraceae bacterium]
MKSKTFRQILAIILTIATFIGIVQISVFALPDNTTVTVTEQQNEENNVEIVEELPAEIVSEEVSLRTENTKYFRLSDGTNQAMMYSQAVHYKDDNGKWKDIDNTLTEKTANGKKTLETTEGSSKVMLPESFANGQKATLAKDGLSVAFALSAENEGVAQNAKVDRIDVDKLPSKEIQEEAGLKAKIVGKGLDESEFLAELKKEKIQATAKDEKGTLAKDASEDKKLEIEQKNAEKTELKNLSSAVKYDNLLPETIFEYIVNSGEIKENIAISAPRENYTYKFDLEIGALRPEPQKDGSILLFDGETAAFVIRAPYAYDALGKYGVATQKLEKIEGKYILTINIDSDWINAEERLFPVVLDPTLTTIFSDETEYGDTYISNFVDRSLLIPISYESGNQNLHQMTVGHREDPEAWARSFVMFKLPNLPENSTILNGTFSLRREATHGSDFTVNAYEVPLSWILAHTGEVVTWSNQPFPQAKNSYLSSPVLDSVRLSSETNYKFDVTKMFQEHYATGRTQMNIMFASANENNGVQYASFYTLNSSNAGVRPYFTVQYLSSYGMESWFSYESFDAGRAGVAYVNDFFRTAQLERSEISINSGKMPVSISRSYWQTWNSNTLNTQLNTTINHPYGNGWKINYNQSLAFVVDSGVNYWEYTGAKGEVTRYIETTTKNDDNTKTKYVPEFLTEENASSCLWVPVSGANVTNIELIGSTGIHKFNASGLLEHIESPLNENDKITISYDSGTAKISQITDGNERKYVFTYTNNMLTNITVKNADNQPITANGTTPLAMNYSYDSAGNLIGVMYPDGEGASYSYDTSFVQLTDVDDYKIKLNLSGVRVTSVQEFSGSTLGNSLTITRSNEHQNIFTDNKGNTLRKQFDIFGRTICVIDKNGQYSADVYKKETDQGGDKKRGIYLGTTGTGAASANLLVNHSAEYDNPAWGHFFWNGGTGAKEMIAHSDAPAGNRVFHLRNDVASGGAGFNQTLNNLASGEDVTISAFIKIPTELSVTTGGAYVGYRYIKTNGEIVDLASEPITLAEDWTRVSKTVQVPNDIGEWFQAFIWIIGATGDVYFDAVQVERGNTAGVYNYANDSDFSQSGAVITVPYTVTIPVASLNKRQVAASTSGGNAANNGSSSWTTGGNFESYCTGNLFYGANSAWQHVAVKGSDVKNAISAALQSQYGNVASWDASKATFYVRSTWGGSTSLNSTTDSAYYKKDFPTTWGQGSAYTAVHEETSKVVGQQGTHSRSYTLSGYNSARTPNEDNDWQVGCYVSRSAMYAIGRQYTLNMNHSDTRIVLTGMVSYSANPVTEANTSANFRDNKLDGKALKLIGNGSDFYAMSSVPVSAKAGDKYLVGLWAKTTGALPTTSNLCTFGFYVKANGTKITNSNVAFDVYNPNWQYLQTLVELPADAPYLDIVMPYNNQAGTAYFDGLQVQLYSKAGDVEETPATNDERQELIGQADTPANAGEQKNTSAAQSAFGTRKTNGFETLYEFEQFDTLGNKTKTIDATGDTTTRNYDENTGLLQSVNSGVQNSVAETGVNLLLNSGFEQADFSIVNDEAVENANQAFEWESSGGVLARSESAARTETFGYNLTQTGSDSAAIAQTVGSVLPSETYKLSGWVKMPSNAVNGLGVAMVIEFFDADEVQISASVVGGRKTSGADWEQISVTATMPEDAVSLRVKARLDGIGTVYLDDLTLETILQASEKPSAATVEPVVYGYNPLGLLASVQQEISGLTDGTAYRNEYNFEHDKIKSISHNGLTYNFEYDIWGNRNSVKVGTANLITYGYSANNRSVLNSITYANGQTIQYIFDSETKQITGISVLGNAAPEYIFGYKNGVLESVTDTLAYTIARVTNDSVEVRSSIDHSLIYSKNESAENYFGQVYTRTKGDVAAYDTLSPEEKALRDYENEHGISTFVINAVGPAEYSNVQKVDYFERVLENQVNAGAIKIQNTYDYLTMPGSRATKLVAGLTNKVAGDTLQSFAYTYDSKGNITSVTTGNESVGYTYDAAGQLTGETTANGTTAWAYNKLGNVVSKTLPDGTVIVYTYDSTWKDKLVSVGGEAIAYDEIGNPVSYGGNTLAWRGKQLAAFNDAEFDYDLSGLRTSKTVNSVKTRYTWHEGKLVGQTDGTDTLYFIYDKTGAPIGFVHNGADVYWYLKNLQGDILGVVDSAGTQIAQYAYDVWGAPLAVEQDGNYAAALAELNPLRYRGYVWDAETGLYYCQSRYYNPQWGRWISPDDIDVALQVAQNIHAVNLWTYCGNNPVILRDESGQSWLGNVGNFLVTQFCQGAVWLLHNLQTQLSQAAEFLTLHDTFTNLYTNWQAQLAGLVNIVENNWYMNLPFSTVLGPALHGLAGLINGGVLSGAVFALGEIGTAIGNGLTSAVSEYIFDGINTIMTNNNHEYSNLGRLIAIVLDSIGYGYDENEQLWYTETDSPFSIMEYHELYNRAAPVVWFVIEDDKFNFNVDGENRRIWLWKGNYGPISIGAECGYYYENLDNDGFWIPFDGYNDHQEGMIPMAMAVYVNDPEMRGDPFFMRNADK